ncbi:TetR/AcrR family transcriptional regulator [Pseudonocardia endophytica]|uniref:TetR family transcriptional regulator n=1 Tax=Pseudonocardia endophytica TaxID=401976 RepID=A0A4R1HTK7_PSEEN|nr:TetR/AcrR family transcriptional regulator [Pseudonocardia endophytica]TCK25558.1 TetR family transcriptional regulator [Pseudonocardia endophytica]
MARPSRWDDVVRAAGKVFRRNGFAGSSLEQVAEEVGMWKGSLYNYISSKDDLLTAVIAIPAERLTAEAREIATGPGDPAERLREIVRCHVDVLVDNYDFVAVYLQEVAGRDIGAQWRAYDREYAALVEQVVREGIASGAVPSGRDPRLTTMTLLGALNWLTRWWDPAGDVGPDVVTAQIADIVLGSSAPVRTG